MFANKNVLLAVAAYALVAHAQSATTSAPSSLPSGLDACILGCATTAAAAANCSSFTNLTCVCTSTAFINAATQCLNQTCTPADVATAEALQKSECANITGASSSVAPSGTGTSATSSATSSAKSGAMAMAPLSFSTLMGTLVASAGALAGAALVL